MSQRVAPWPLFNPGGRRTDEIDETQSGPKRPELKLVKGGAAPRLERMTPRVRLVSLMVMVAVVLFAVVMCHVLLSQGQFRLEALQKQANEQQDTYEKLRLQVAELESPARITNEAQTRLGMIIPEKITPVAPNADDIASGAETVVPTSPASTGDDLDNWAEVKPYLDSSK